MGKTQKHFTLPLESQDQPWRTEPEIHKKWQEELAKCRTSKRDVEKGINPFKDMKLNRDDVEWLLATHENGRGPVDWNVENQRKRKGLDLRGANLSNVNLNGLPLACILGGITTTLDQRTMAAIHLEMATLREAHLEGANLTRAQLKGAFLPDAHLEEANFREAHLEEVNFRGAHLEGADLRNAFFNTATNFDGTFFSNAKGESVRLAGVRWSDVDLTLVDWSLVKILGDEVKVRQRERLGGKLYNRNIRLVEYRRAVRANHQLALALQVQGLNEDASRFAYRAQLLQRKVFWLQV